MTGILALACFMTGFIVAWLLRTGYVAAQVSWAQEQMERKVRYWQAETARAQAEADRLAGAATQRAMPPGPGGESWEL